MEYEYTEKFLSDTLDDCKAMLKYVYADSKSGKDMLKKYKKNIKEMKKKLDESGIQGICEV